MKKTGIFATCSRKTSIITTEETLRNWKAQILDARYRTCASRNYCNRSIFTQGITCRKKELENEKKYKNKSYEFIPSIKPIDVETIVALAKETKAIVTVKNIRPWGNGFCCSRSISVENYPVLTEFIGIKDNSGQSGTPDELA